MSGRSKNRTHVANIFITQAKISVCRALDTRLTEKGKGTFAARHELIGILDEEFTYELKKASHDSKKDFTAMRDELHDIAVACIFGVACIDAKTMDWRAK